MKIPKALKIIGLVWKVKEDQSISEHTNSFGTTSFHELTINLEKNIPKLKKEQVLIHEIIHALWWQMGFSERYKETPKIEEEVVTTLSMGLYQVLNDNKLLK